MVDSLDPTEFTFKERIGVLISDGARESKIYALQWVEKMRGGNVKPPPGMPLSSVLFSMSAAFITVLIMASISQYFKSQCGDTLGFELGLIGGISTLVLTQSAAPGAQPGSIILAQAICMLVETIFTYIPGTGTEDPFDSPLNWLRVAASVSVACAFMARFGVVHPPGGGLAVSFLRFKWNDVRGFQKMGVLLLQDVLFIGIASMIQNLNTNPAKRYPTYWGSFPNMLSSFVRKIFCPKKKKVQ